MFPLCWCPRRGGGDCGLVRVEYRVYDVFRIVVDSVVCDLD